MSTPLPQPAKFIPITRALDGARILWRHYLRNVPPSEGWVREFSNDGTLVRISRANGLSDRGVWHRVYDLRCEGVLEPAKAPLGGEDEEDEA